MVYLLISPQQIWASPCVDLEIAVGAIPAVSVLQAESWGRTIADYLSSAGPNYEDIRAIMGTLKSIDTSQPQAQRNFQYLAVLLKSWAENFGMTPPPPSSTTLELAAKLEKLKLLNTPSLWNLLEKPLQPKKLARCRNTYRFSRRSLCE